MIVYKEGNYIVEAQPCQDGRVRFRLYQHFTNLRSNYFATRAKVLAIRKGGGSRCWWQPWTWRRISTHEALFQLIRLAKKYDQEDAEAAANIRAAQCLIESMVEDR